MEDQISRSDLLGNVVRPPSSRVGSSLKPTLSGRLTPRNSPPPLRRSQSSRTPRKEAKVYASPLQRIRARRLLPWLMMIVIWSYVGFVVQSKWAHGGRKEGFTAFGSRVEVDHDLRSNVLVEDESILNGLKKMDEAISIRSNGSEHMGKDNANGKTSPSIENSRHLPPSIENSRHWLQSPMNLARWLWHQKFVNGLQKAGTQVFRSNSSAQNLENSSNTSADQKVGTKHAARVQSFHDIKVNNNAGAGMTDKGNNTMSRNIVSGMGRAERMKRNTSFGLLVGPFDKTENRVLGWNAGKRYSTCDRKGLFAHVVRGRSFIVVLHELSMTGAPLAMMELAAEILSCGGRVSAVALSKKGGLMEELVRRGIKVLKDKTVTSYRVAMKADLVIVGSAVSASWIEQYLVRNRRGASRLVWWIMENRRQYFDRSKHMLPKDCKLP